jgi:nucleotide-binding universal stress UspA family protein
MRIETAGGIGRKFIGVRFRENAMPLAKILVPLAGGDRDCVALATAFALAKPFNAHVEALFSYPDSRQAIPATEMTISPQIAQEILDAAETGRKSACQAARAALAQAAGDGGIRILDHPERMEMVTASYRQATGRPQDTVLKAARLADIVVFPPLARGDAPDMHEAFVDVLTKSERPVLLCAAKAPKTIATKIAIGWDGREAAAHALIAAVPFLEAAGTANLFCIRKFFSGEYSIAEAHEYLGLHNVQTTETTIDGDRPVGDMLLDAAMKAGCDLLVAGGYGHGRMLESIFGGTTAYLTSHADIPILMAH